MIFDTNFSFKGIFFIRKLTFPHHIQDLSVLLIGLNKVKRTKNIFTLGYLINKRYRLY